MSGRFRGRAAKVVEEVVRPVAEDLALKAKKDAAQIGAARQIWAIGCRQALRPSALAVIAPIQLHQPSDRRREISVSRRNRRTPICDGHFGCGSLLLLHLRILVLRVALHIRHLVRQILNLLFQRLDFAFDLVRAVRVGVSDRNEGASRSSRQQRCRQFFRYDLHGIPLDEFSRGRSLQDPADLSGTWRVCSHWPAMTMKFVWLI